MKKRNDCRTSHFHTGELYLFHPHNPRCPAETSLWGFHHKSTRGIIYLEHSTSDHRHFRRWHQLPKRYHYCRLATRDELRDYMYNLGLWDSATLAVFSGGNTHR